MTQLDLIRQQAESAARNAAAGAAGRLRRDTSLVSQAAQLTGRALRQGEAAWRQGREAPRRRQGTPGETVEEPPRTARAAGDGYVRRSPVQPVCRAADYRRRQVRRAAGVVLLAGLICAGLILFSRLGLFGR